MEAVRIGREGVGCQCWELVAGVRRKCPYPDPHRAVAGYAASSATTSGEGSSSGSNSSASFWKTARTNSPFSSVVQGFPGSRREPDGVDDMGITTSAALQEKSRVSRAMVRMDG